MPFAAGGVGTGVFEGVLEIADGESEAGGDTEEETDGDGKQEGPDKGG